MIVSAHCCPISSLSFHLLSFIFFYYYSLSLYLLPLHFLFHSFLSNIALPPSIDLRSLGTKACSQNIPTLSLLLYPQEMGILSGSSISAKPNRHKLSTPTHHLLPTLHTPHPPHFISIIHLSTPAPNRRRWFCWWDMLRHCLQSSPWFLMKQAWPAAWPCCGAIWPHPLYYFHLTILMVTDSWKSFRSISFLACLDIIVFWPQFGVSVLDISFQTYSVSSCSVCNCQVYFIISRSLF